MEKRGINAGYRRGCKTVRGQRRAKQQQTPPEIYQTRAKNENLRHIKLSYCEIQSAVYKVFLFSAICFCWLPVFAFFVVKNPCFRVFAKRNAESIENAAHVAVEPVGRQWQNLVLVCPF